MNKEMDEEQVQDHLKDEETGGGGSHRSVKRSERCKTLFLVTLTTIVIAAILIIVSVCLILISFLVLRFTIVFTLQEDFKEIGIMKAIGIRDKEHHYPRLQYYARQLRPPLQ